MRHRSLYLCLLGGCNVDLIKWINRLMVMRRSCSTCPYALGWITYVVSPCPMCKGIIGPAHNYYTKLKDSKAKNRAR